MKVIDLLEKHHRELESLLSRIRTGEGPPQKLVAELADTLIAHQVIEEQVFYPAMQKELSSRRPTTDLVLECMEEHAVTTIALRRLLATEPDERAFSARLTVLRDLLLSHIAEEEEELFSRVLEVFDEHTQLEMGTHLEQLFDDAKSRGHQAILSGEETPRRNRPKVVRLNGRANGRTHIH